LLLACLLRPLPSNGRCLQRHYLIMAILQLFISRSLPSKGSTCHNINTVVFKYIDECSLLQPDNKCVQNWNTANFTKLRAGKTNFIYFSGTNPNILTFNKSIITLVFWVHIVMKSLGFFLTLNFHKNVDDLFRLVIKLLVLIRTVTFLSIKVLIFCAYWERNLNE
jgi:hypothetical protein